MNFYEVYMDEIGKKKPIYLHKGRSFNMSILKNSVICYLPYIFIIYLKNGILRLCLIFYYSS